MKAVKQAEIAGSLRRRRETVGDVDLICSLKDTGATGEVSKAFTTFPEVERVLGQGSTKASIVTAGGLQVDLRIVPPESFGRRCSTYGIEGPQHPPARAGAGSWTDPERVGPLQAQRV
jgi:DNA polymerase/3'-5' exonuclease PolX